MVPTSVWRRAIACVLNIEQMLSSRNFSSGKQETHLKKVELRKNRQKTGLQVSTQIRNGGRRLQSIVHDTKESAPYVARIAEATRSENWEEALEAFEQATTKSTILYTALIRAAIMCKKPRYGLQLYEELQSSGCQLDIHARIQGLDVFALLGRNNDVTRVWKEIKENGIHASTASAAYNTVINARAIAGDVYGAIDHISEMAAGGRAPDVQHYGSLLKACGKARNAPVAKNCLSAMQKRNIPRNVIIYTSCIVAHTDASTEDIKQVVREMQKDRVRLDATFFDSYVQTLFGKQARELMKIQHFADEERLDMLKELLLDAKHNGQSLPHHLEVLASRWNKSCDKSN